MPDGRSRRRTTGNGSTTTSGDQSEPPRAARCNRVRGERSEVGRWEEADWTHTSHLPPPTSPQSVGTSDLVVRPVLAVAEQTVEIPTVVARPLVVVVSARVLLEEPPPLAVLLRLVVL